MENKTEFYKWIKTAGFVSFIPFVLLCGPLGGYFLGDYLQKRFNLSWYAVIIFIAIGFIFSLSETIRIIKKVIRMDKKSSSGG